MRRGRGFAGAGSPTLGGRARWFVKMAFPESLWRRFGSEAFGEGVASTQANLGLKEVGAAFGEEQGLEDLDVVGGHGLHAHASAD